MKEDNLKFWKNRTFEDMLKDATETKIWCELRLTRLKGGYYEN